MKALSGLAAARDLFPRTAEIRLSPIKDIELRAQPHSRRGLARTGHSELRHSTADQALRAGEDRRAAPAPLLGDAGLAEAARGDRRGAASEAACVTIRDDEIIVTVARSRPSPRRCSPHSSPGDEVLVVSPTLRLVPAGDTPGRRNAALRAARTRTQNFDLDPDAHRAPDHPPDARDPALQSEQPDRYRLLARADRAHAGRRRAARSAGRSPTRSTRTSSTTSRDLQPRVASEAARARRARVLVLESVRHDRLARRIPAPAPASASPTSSRCTTRWSPARRWSRSTPRWRRSSSASAVHRQFRAEFRAPARPRHRAPRPPAARLRLPEAERLVLRLPARQGHRAAGARFAPAGAPTCSSRRTSRWCRASPSVRPARRTCGSATPPSRRDRRGVRAARGLFSRRPAEPASSRLRGCRASAARTVHVGYHGGPTPLEALDGLSPRATRCNRLSQLARAPLPRPGATTSRRDRRPLG